MRNRFRSFFELISETYRITRPYGRRRLLVVFGLMLMQALFQVVGVGSVYPFLALAANPDSVRESSTISRIVDFLPPMTDEQLLMWAGIAAIVMLFVSNGANLVSEIGRVRYARGFGHWLSVRLLREITDRPYAYFLDRNSGELFKKVLADVPAYVNGVLLNLLEGTARVVIAIVLVAFLIFISPSVAFGAVLFFGLFYSLFFGLLKNLRRRIRTNLKAARRGISKEATQLLSAIKPVKVHDVREHYLERFAKHSYTQAKESAWLPLIGNGTRYVVEPLAFGGLVVVVLVMSGDRESFAQLVPTLGVMALAGYRLMPAVQKLYNCITAVSTNRHVVEEISEEFAKVEERLITEKRTRRKKGVPRETPTALPLEQGVEVQDLSFTYPQAERPIFEGLSFEIPANTSFAIVGRTGSGKSTLVDILLGLHRPTSGRVLVDGTEITPANVIAWRARIGYVPQDIVLMDDTIAANIAFGLPPAEIDPEQLREAASRAQILEFIENQLPGGFDAMVGERGVRLSGGQRQRIGLARALYRRPKVLVLDEATSALDVETEKALVEALEELHGQLTMIVIAHRLSTIERCERRLDLDGCQEERLLSAV